MAIPAASEPASVPATDPPMLTWIETAAGPRPPVTDGILLRRRMPCPAVRRDLVQIVGYRETLRGTHLRQIQPAALTVPWILSFGDPFLVGLGPAGKADRRGGSFVAGPIAAPAVIDSFGAAACLRIDFTLPGARRFFGLPLHALAGRIVPLEAIFGAEAAGLRDRLGAEPDWERRFDLVEGFVANRVLRSGHLLSPAIRAFERLERSGGAERIGELAAWLGWSRKHLAARFRDEIGLPPKTVARLARFNRLLALARRREGAEWAALASDCRYADQAHLAREFKTLAGERPSAWRARLA